MRSSESEMVILVSGLNYAQLSGLALSQADWPSVSLVRNNKLSPYL